MRKRVLCIFGTRPEAIKMAPVALALKARPKTFDARIAVTAQHRGMLDQVLARFRLKADHDLDLMRPGQSLTDVTARGLARLEPVLAREQPDLALVHGDTTTTLVASLACFYRKIPVGHVEAGLRSFDPHNPYPEEINRRLTDAVCALHFAPTRAARRNLLRESVPAKGIFVTGNTGIDALKIGVRRLAAGDFGRASPAVRAASAGPFVLITAHRRENFGKPLADFCRAVARLAARRPGLSFVYPVHPNPNVEGPVRKALGRIPNVRLLPPLDYADFLPLLQKAILVLTDSGGLQEEAPSLGKPVLVLRKVTERPEAVKAGTVKVIGTDTAAVEGWVNALLDDARLYKRMAAAVNPYGDGRAAERIVQALEHYFGNRSARPQEFAS